MKSLGHFLNEAKATYCGRCDTTHVAPSKGGTCPALKEGSDDSDDVPFKGPYRKAGERKDEYGNKIKNVAKHLAKKAMKTMTPKTEETKMKTLRDFLEENVEKPGTFSHFNHHLKMWHDHTAKASRIEDSRRYTGTSSEPHWDAAEEHENILHKHYDKKRVTHAMDDMDVSTAAGRKQAWNHVTTVKEQVEVAEAHDIELKPHENGTHYIVHKIHPKSGIEKDQLQKGEKLSDTHVDDLHDMGYKVKIHSS